MDGLSLNFRLAGINNQNFLMRDEETGTFWQQISGKAISGPLAGRQLVLVPSDELTFGLWKTEQPNATLLKESAEDAGRYAKKDWEERMQQSPTVLSYAQEGVKPRTLVLGVRADGIARAYPHDIVLAEKVVLDRLGGVPIVIAVGPDGRSVRGFRSQMPGGGKEIELYRTGDGDGLLMDDITGSRWNFQGCAVAGQAAGVCLERVELTKDYWFDWRQYNPETSVFRRAGRLQR